MLRQLFLSTDPSAQPFAVSGSGTLGWDFVAANLVERGEDVLVLHTGMCSPLSSNQKCCSGVI
jgi:alanine-glyoxylate transaminase/serine-glyoxylate transaminase/serine-pyruvate transaminase